jgi:hypothetical protein
MAIRRSILAAQMTRQEVARRRLRSERLVGSRFARPEQVVQWLGAVQSQDYAGAKWGIGQRTRDATDADLDRLFDAGTILRTHVLRPTWHFVMPADIRWMLTLTAPRVKAAMAYYDRQLALDERTFARASVAARQALRGGVHLTRTQLAEVYRSAGIVARGQRLGHLLMRAELEGIVCSGPRRGKQFTYALLDERAPDARRLSPPEALAELTRRYFASHGPAQAPDFAWWSGLTITQARAGIALVKDELQQDDLEGKPIWYAGRAGRQSEPAAHLLPNYDEYCVGFKDQSPLFATPRPPDPSRRSALMVHLIALDGQIVGGWRRTVGRTEITVTITLTTRLGKAQREALDAAAERYARFMARPVRVVTAAARA